MFARIALLLFAASTLAGIVAATTPLSGRADAEAAPRTAKAVRGATPYAAIKDEPAPKLIVAPRFPICWPRASSGSSGGWTTCAS
jgi:hypothetical protein